MRELSKPSPELAAKLQEEVGYGDKLTGYKMNAMSGYEQTSIYSLEETLPFLYMDAVGELLAPGNAGSMGYMDLLKLKEWVANVLGDSELADAIGDILDSTENYKEGVSPVRELIVQRLEQCREVLAVESEEAAEPQE